MSISIRRGSFPTVDPADDPHHHLRFRPTTGELQPAPASIKARPTIDTFDLNGIKTRRRLAEGRSDAFHTLKDLLLVYRRHILAGDVLRADEVKGRILRYPFSSVLYWMIAVAKKPGAGFILNPSDPAGTEVLDILDTIKSYNLQNWL